MLLRRLRKIIRRHRHKWMLLCSVILITFCVVLYVDRQDLSRVFSAVNTKSTFGVPSVPKYLFTRSTPISQNATTILGNATEYIINQRKEFLMDRCKATTKDRSGALSFTHYMYNGKYNFLYCHVEKCGSTFWRRVIQQINRNKAESPFNIKPQDNMAQYTKGLGLKEMKRINTILQKSTKFVFTRNPYHRLFSGYIDKIYSPNPTFWKLLGKYIVQIFRKGTPKTHCGHDVTFYEYIQFAIHSESTGTHGDMHTESVWRMCNPCKIDFDIIGKMESFNDDVFYIFNKLNIGSYKQTLRNISKDATMDAIYDVAQAYIDMRKDASKCMSEDKIIERIWRKLQIRGLVSINIPVPHGLANLNDDMSVFKLFKDANANSTRKQLKQQQHSILLEAFSGIPLDTLYKYAEVFRRDFELFGYNPYPDEMFKRTNTTPKYKDMLGF